MNKLLKILLVVCSSFLIINAESSSLRAGFDRELQQNETEVPTNSPTNAPTVTITGAPTSSPTNSPTGAPTNSPTGSPTASPTASPTESPTRSPTMSPTRSPTESPTASPTASPTNSPTTSPTKNPTRSPLPSVPENDDGIDFAVVGGAIGGTLCLFVILGGFFIFVLLGRRSNRVGTGKKPVDENLLRSLAVLDQKKQEDKESKRVKQSTKVRNMASLELDQDAQITDLRADPTPPESVISSVSSAPPPGLESGPKSVISAASSQPPPGISSPTPQKPVMPRLSEVSVASAPKLEPPGLGRGSQMSLGSSAKSPIPRLSSGNVNSLPRVMSKSLEKQKLTAELKDQAEQTANIEKKPSVLDE